MTTAHDYDAELPTVYSRIVPPFSNACSYTRHRPPPLVFHHPSLLQPTPSSILILHRVTLSILIFLILLRILTFTLFLDLTLPHISICATHLCQHQTYQTTLSLCMLIGMATPCDCFRRVTRVLPRRVIRMLVSPTRRLECMMLVCSLGKDARFLPTVHIVFANISRICLAT